MSKSYYFTNETIGQGLPILSKHGAIAKQRLVEYLSKLLLEKNYIPVATPHIGNIELFEKSGHYPYYKDSMFPTINKTEDEHGIITSLETYVLKPMNCPFHIAAYEDLGIVSYKELPVKFYEFGQVYRYESSGALNGLFRVRSFTQDDGHIFCSMNQIREIVNECIELVKLVCKRFGLEVTVRFSKRDMNDLTKYVGTIDNWGASEDILKAICAENFDNNYEEEIGGAAFYGPKIDFGAKDKLGRNWQLGTIQLDFNLPTRFGVHYINDEGKKETPVLIHRALLGSIERFLGILIENNSMNLFLQPFNMGIIWIGEDEHYMNTTVDFLHRKGIYPTVIKKPKNLSEAMVKLYAHDIDNIIVIGKKEEKDKTLTLNKKTLSLVLFSDEIYELLN